MLPPGRRRGLGSSPIATCIAFLYVFIFTANAASSVLGIDFGTLNLKAAIVKPGIPLDIVLTKDSKRKEVAAVAFKSARDSKNSVVLEAGTFPERAYGGDALALQGRMPGEVFPNLKPLLGMSLDTTALDSYKERYPLVQVEQDPTLGTTLIKSAAFVEGEIPWSVEELLAMEFENIKKNAESMAGRGNVVKDVVITIPAFYTADERRAIERAATLTGFEINALVSDGLAVGVDYAKSRTFPEVTKGEKPEHHLVFDMGAGSTTATVLRFQGRTVKDVGRFNKTVQEVAVLGVGWDRTLGGDSLTNVILNDYVHKFLTKPALKNRGTSEEEIKGNGRLMARLWKEAEKARGVLSANTETSSSFEELLPDIDFRVKLTRSYFEELTSEFANRVANPINDALAAAKLSMPEIDSIILHGGAVRTPFVQRKLEGIAGGSAKLRSNVNADESAVFGAAFKSAGLSPSFKVKEIRDSDIGGYAATMIFTDGTKERKQTLFSPTSPWGHGASTKQVTFKDKDDFTFSFSQQIGEVHRPISAIKTENLTASVKALKDKFGCDKEEISTKFNIKLSPVDGLPIVIGGTVSCEVEGSGKSESIGDSVKGWLGFGKKDQEPLKEGEESAEPVEEVQATPPGSTSEAQSTTTSSGSKSSAISKTPENPKKRTESIPVAFNTIVQGNPQPAPEEMKRMADRLAAFDRSDRARFEREEALNVLEGYTYYARDFLNNAEYNSVSTQEQRDEISKLLAASREFMEDSKEVAKSTKETLKDKLDKLKGLVDPIHSRKKEAAARPEMTNMLKKALKDTEKFIKVVQSELEKASAAMSKASAFDASQSSTSATESSETAEGSTTAAPSIRDELEELEEPDTSLTAETSTTTELAPKYSSYSDFTAYTDYDLSDLQNAYDEVTKWLAEMEAEQEKLAPHEEPAFRIEEIETVADQLGRVMKDLLYKQNAFAARSSKRSSKSSSKTKAGSKKNGGTKSKSPTDSEPTAVNIDLDDDFFKVDPDQKEDYEDKIQEMIKRARQKEASMLNRKDKAEDVDGAGAPVNEAKDVHDEL